MTPALARPPMFSETLTAARARDLRHAHARVLQLLQEPCAVAIAEGVWEEGTKAEDVLAQFRSAVCGEALG